MYFVQYVYMCIICYIMCDSISLLFPSSLSLSCKHIHYICIIIHNTRNAPPIRHIHHLYTHALTDTKRSESAMTNLDSILIEVMKTVPSIPHWHGGAYMYMYMYMIMHGLSYDDGLVLGDKCVQF